MNKDEWVKGIVKICDFHQGWAHSLSPHKGAMREELLEFVTHGRENEKKSAATQCA